MAKDGQPTAKRMKCVLREQVDAMGETVRGLFGEQAENPPDFPAYSTADNFIRKGTGNIETAWMICQKMGITLDAAFIPEDMPFEYAVAQKQRKDKAEDMLREIIDLVIGKGKIHTVMDVAEILGQIAQSISTVGYKEEGAEIYRIASDAIRAAEEKEKGGVAGEDS
jgi:hypothetical protein